MAGRLSAILVLGGAAAAGAGATVAMAVRRPESQLLGATLVAAHDPQEVALTYDDGPNTRSTPELLDVLARFEVRATFFVVGRFVREQRELLRRVQAGGHLLGNHTMTHPFLATKPVRVVRDEVRGCSEAIEDACGAPVRYFRPPYGARRPAVLHAVRELGLVPVLWNVQGNDWEPIGVPGILRHLDHGMQRVAGQRRGANILLHDGFDGRMDFDRADTVRATELLLLRARERELRVVTVDAWG